MKKIFLIIVFVLCVILSQDAIAKIIKKKIEGMI